MLRPAAFLALAAAACSSCDRPAPARAGASASSYLNSLPLQPVGGVVRVGPVKPCAGPHSLKASIVNQSSEVQRVERWASNCACLSAQLVGDPSIGPGEVREVELSIAAGGVGERSVRVEFVTAKGFAGVLRVDYSMNDSVSAVPADAEAFVQGAPEAFDVTIVSNDGEPVKVLSIDPPVGSVGGVPGVPASVVVSSAEVLAFALGPAGKGHPAVQLDAQGSPAAVRVRIVTDHPDCPEASFLVHVRR
jgi:hypothetical protein